MSKLLPPKEKLTICFAHAAYMFAERYAARRGDIRHFEVRTVDDLKARIGEADIAVVSMLWRNDLTPLAGKLRYIQSISSGTDQFDKALLKAKGVRLASAAGVNAAPVAQHAMGMMLALARLIHTGRDHQKARHWRGMIGDISKREDELTGKTLLIFGMGRIGSKLARIAKAFDMTVIGVKRDPSTGADGADEIHGSDRLLALLPRADIVALTCPLTPQTENLIGTKALAAMKPTAYLINVARGKVVDEDALIKALATNRIAGAGLDVTREEPLAPSSSLWTMDNVLLTPHSGGDSRRYEDNVLDILDENLARLWRGETGLRNEIV